MESSINLMHSSSFSNPLRRTARRAWIITLFGVVMIFGPMNLDWANGMDAGYAIAAFGVLFIIIGLVISFIYGKLARRLDEILSGEKLLAHWTYSDEEWRQYTETDYKIDRREKWQLFLIVAGISVVVGVFLALLNPEAWWIFACIILGLIAFTGLAAWLSTLYFHHKNKTSKSAVWISENGVYFNKILHAWNVIGSKFERIKYLEETPRLIEFEYSVISRSGRDHQTVRVPVPLGKESLAANIVEKFRALSTNK